MSKVKFIDTVFLKKNTTIQENVDDNFLVSSIYMVQDTHLQQVLGSTFYNRLKEGVINNDLNANESALITDYIQNMVCRWTFYEVIPFINYKFTNKAVSKENSEWSQNSELSEIKYLQNVVRDQAEFYTKRLQNFLCDNESLFPEYQNPDDKENLKRSSKAYFNGVYLPKVGKIDKYHKRYE